jgi:hypothetical protein
MLWPPILAGTWSQGAFHFFAHRREVVKYKEKRAGERREHESQEEHTAAESGRCSR